MRKTLVLALPAIAFMPSAALAQMGPPSPLERDRPDFEPVGARIGSFEVHPFIETKAEFDSNVLALPDGGPSDEVLILESGFRLESLWQRHSVEANAYVRQSLHNRFSREDALEGGGRITGTYDISRETSVRATLRAAFLAEDRTSITDVSQAREPTRFRRFEANTAVNHDFGTLQMTFDGTVVGLDFDDATAADGSVIEQDFRDSVYYRGALTAAYEISPRVAALLRGQVDRLDYSDDGQLPGTLDRDSTGFALEAGTRLELTSLITGEIRAGVLHRNSDDPLLNNTSGISFGANLQWDVTPLTTVRLFADRQVEESGSLFNSGNIRSQARATAEHELLRNLVLKAEGRVARIESVGQIEEEADEYQVSVGFRYLANRRLRVTAEVGRFERSASEGFFREFASNRVSVGVRWVF